MKESVVDIHDLQEAAPFFKSRFGSFLGKVLIKWLSIDKVNKAHAHNCHLRGAEFTTALLNDPIDIFASRRPDFKVMVNGVLTKIGAMGDNFVSVKPDSNNQGANLKNINGVRISLQQLKEGHPMGFFPSGGIWMYNKKTKKIQDLPWTHSVIRLIRKAKVPVYPVYFDFLNSRFFYWLGRIDWRIRTLRIPAEAFNKRGRTVDVYIGEPVSPEEIQNIADDKDLAEFLYQRTYAAKK